MSKIGDVVGGFRLEDVRNDAKSGVRVWRWVRIVECPTCHKNVRSDKIKEHAEEHEKA